MQRAFLFNIVLLVFINLLVKPFFIFGIDLRVQNTVPEGDYGLYFTLFNFTYIFQILNDFGIQNYNNRNIARHPVLLPKFFPNLLWLKFLLGILYFVITAAAAVWLAGYDGRAMILLSILLINQIITQFIFFFRSNISGLGHFRTDSLLSSLDKFLMLLTCGWALWLRPSTWQFSIEMFAGAQTLALLLTAGICFWVLRRLRSDFPLLPSWRWQWWKIPPQLLVMLRQSFPYALVILLMTAYTRLDAVLLERLLPDGKLHADAYAGAYRLLDAANMLGYLFATLLLPMFSKLLEPERREELRKLVSLSFKLIWVGSLTLATVIFFARQPLVELMMPDRASAYRWTVLGILIWTFVPVATTYIFSTLLTANQNLMMMNRFFVLGLLLDVLLNVLLIPHFQAVGSAIATLGTQCFIAGAMFFLSLRVFKFRASGGGVLRWLLASFLVLSVNFLIFENTNWQWYWQSVAAGGLSLTSILLLVRLRSVG